MTAETADSASKTPSHRRVVLITGCSSGGIGHHLALEFALRGFTVYASARNPTKIDTALAARGVTSIQMDVTCQDSVDEAVTRVLREAGCIDILVNNAGQMCVGPVVEVPVDRAQALFNVNVMGVSRVCRAVAPHMMDRRKGVVVNVGSVSGYMTTPWVGYYAASKAALHTMSDALRMELEPFDVKVVVVAPGSVKSHLVDAQRNNRLLEDGSRYSLAEDAVQARAELSQREAPMDTELFARKMVDRVLEKNPSTYITFGGNAFVAWVAYFVPPGWRDFYLARRFGTSKLKADLKDADKPRVGGACPVSHSIGGRCPVGNRQGGSFLTRCPVTNPAAWAVAAGAFALYYVYKHPDVLERVLRLVKNVI
ncbi:hypothetical protein FB645_002900 [Coemansia sp. IMI 203386]|nr:hypothetical protein FB645_002900 [Coemansia sp. IMI 203386]